MKPTDSPIHSGTALMTVTAYIDPTGRTVAKFATTREYDIQHHTAQWKRENGVMMNARGWRTETLERIRIPFCPKAIDEQVMACIAILLGLDIDHRCTTVTPIAEDYARQYVARHTNGGL